MLIVIAVVVIAVMQFYFWKRVIRDTRWGIRTRRVLVGAQLALAAAMTATLLQPFFTGTAAAGWYAWPGYLWLVLAFYFSLSMFALEPVRMVLLRRSNRKPRTPILAGAPAPPTDPEEPRHLSQNLDRRTFLARTTALAAGAASVGLVGFGVSRALGTPDLLQVPIQLRRLDPAFNGFRIAVVSDIHLGPLLGRAHTERIVGMINETNADLVAVVGDLVDGTVGQLGHAAEPLQDLVSREGTFFVTGNHEYFVDDTQEWLRELERFGINLLRNENTAIRRGDASFNLAGVNDVTGVQKAEPPDFDRALAGIDATQPIVLLAHQPVLVNEAAARGVDLQVSGHTHGGQMWPFQYVVEAVQPSLAGFSVVDDTQLYVTRGAGFWGPPVRIGAPPDITVLTLAQSTVSAV